MLAYDWLLALVAFAVAAPLAFVLRSVQRHLVAAYDKARERNAEVLTARQRGGLRRRDAARLRRRASTTPSGTKRSSHERSNAFIRAGTIGAFLFPSGEVFSVLDRRRRRRRRRHPRARRRADGRRAGRLHLPHLPVPRADRRVHRGARPDADRRGRPAPGARRADIPIGPPDRRSRRSRCRPGTLDVSIERRRRSRTAAAATTRTTRRCCVDVNAHDPRRPAGRRRRRDRVRQDHARPPDRPLRRPDHRARCASAACR